MKVTIVLPLPSAKLTAQQGVQRFVKADATRKAREEAGWVAIAAIATQVDTSEWDATNYVMAKATIRYQFYLRTNVRADEANLIQTAKAYIDGCVDAKLIAGDHWQALHIAGVSVDVDAKNPRVELIFERVE